MAKRFKGTDREREKKLEAIVRTARQGERVRLKPSLPPVLRPGSIAYRALELQRRRLLEVEDRRRYHPLRVAAPAKRVSGQVVKRLNVAPVRKSVIYRPMERDFLPYRVMFSDPKSVLVCMRRKARRAVLHALKLTGSGSGSRQRGKPHRRSLLSGVHCG